jgi:phosphomannomutase/phosphoglucomutase
MGRAIKEVITVNGERVPPEHPPGCWCAARRTNWKSSSWWKTHSADDMRDLFRREVKPRLAKRPEVGAYNQEI